MAFRPSWRLIAAVLAALVVLTLLAYWLIDRQTRSLATEALAAFARELPEDVVFSYADVEADPLGRRMTLRGVSLLDQRGPEPLRLDVETITLDKVDRGRDYLDADRLLLSGLQLSSEDGTLDANLQDLDIHDIHLPLPQALPPGEVIQAVARQTRFESALAEGFTLRRAQERIIRGRMGRLHLTGFAEGRLNEIEIADLLLERAAHQDEPASEIEQVSIGHLSAQETDIASLFLDERTYGLLRAAPTALDVDGFSINRLGLPTLSSDSLVLRREGGEGGAAMAFSAAWDTITIPLEYLRSPELRRLLLALDYRNLELTGEVVYRFETEDHGLVLEPLRLAIGGMGSLEGRLSLDRLPPSVPGLLHLPQGGWQALRVRDAALTYSDASLAERLIALGASESGMEKEAFRGLLLSELEVIARYGSGDPLQKETLGALASFLVSPQGLSFQALPEDPISLAEIFTAPVLTGPAIPALNPSVTALESPVRERAAQDTAAPAIGEARSRVN